MDWTTIITCLITFVGGGGLAAFLLLPQKRKEADLENERKQSQMWRDLYDEQVKINVHLNTTIDGLWIKIEGLRDENNTLSTKVATLTILKCESVGCGTRIPPLGTITKLIEDGKN